MSYYPYSTYSPQYNQIQIIPSVVSSNGPHYAFNPVGNINNPTIIYNRNEASTFKTPYSDASKMNNHIKMNKENKVSTIFELPQINQSPANIQRNDHLKLKTDVNLQKKTEPPKDPPKPIQQPALYLFDVSLCNQRYQTVKTIPIPFDMRMSNNGRFDCLDDAMTFVGRHCHHHHNQFTKQLAKMYLPFCRVMSFELGKYVIPRNLKKIEFESAFAVAQKRISMDNF